MPDDEYHFLPPPQLMQPAEIEQLAKTFVALGVNKIRFTGGEPLVRKEFADIITRLAALPVTLTLTTNGVLLPQHLPLLLQSGIRSVNISLDSLQSDTFNLITKRNYFSKVWDAIHKALDAGLHVKVNMVVMKGINDHEVIDFIEWTKHTPVHVRFIEFMPFSGNHWNNQKVISWPEMLQSIEKHYSTVKLKDEASDTARKYIVPGHIGTFAVISTMSHPFCDTCNRIRLTADGKLKNCLFSTSETDLLSPLRKGEDVVPLIVTNIKGKAAALGGQFDTRLEQVNPEEIQNRSMIAIGG